MCRLCAPIRGAGQPHCVVWVKRALPLSLLSLQYVEDNLGVMSVGFLLSSPDDAVIWRGPKKNGLLLPQSSFPCVFLRGLLAPASFHTLCQPQASRQPWHRWLAPLLPGQRG